MASVVRAIYMILKSISILSSLVFIYCIWRRQIGNGAVVGDWCHLLHFLHLYPSLSVIKNDVCGDNISEFSLYRSLSYTPCLFIASLPLAVYRCLSLSFSWSLTLSLYRFSPSLSRCLSTSFSWSLILSLYRFSPSLSRCLSISFSWSLNELVSYHDLGNALPADIEHFGASGATQVLVKPVSLQVLGEALSVASQWVNYLVSLCVIL